MDVGGWSSAGTRPLNEDSYLALDLSAHSVALGGLRAFLVVSDGMGGHSSGDVASRTAVETAQAYVGQLLRMAESATLSVDPRVALSEIVAEADRAVTAAAAAGGGSIGATFTAAFVAKDHVWVGHVGDSRAYLLRGGEARKLTSDHSRVGRMVTQGVLTEAQAQQHPDRHLIESALGFGGAEVELEDMTLTAKDAVLLCTDGVHSVLSSEEMIAQAASTKDPASAARGLADAAVAAGSDDNVTAVLWAEEWGAYRAGVPAALLVAPRRARVFVDGAKQVRFRRRRLVALLGVVTVVALAAMGAWRLSASGGEPLESRADVVSTESSDQNTKVAGGTVGPATTSAAPTNTSSEESSPTSNAATSSTLGRRTRGTSTSTARPVTRVKLTISSLSGAGGTITRKPNQPTFDQDSSVTLTAVPDPGYKFTGWGGSASGTTNPLMLKMDSDKTVTATFSAVSVSGVTGNQRTVGRLYHASGFPSGILSFMASGGCEYGSAFGASVAVVVGDGPINPIAIMGSAPCLVEATLATEHVVAHSGQTVGKPSPRPYPLPQWQPRNKPGELGYRLERPL